MPRRGITAKRDVLPDPLYHSKIVTRLINNVMYDGKKGVAQKIVYGAFDIVKDKTGKEPLEIFEQAMENVMPSLEVKARRVGGATNRSAAGAPPDARPALDGQVRAASVGKDDEGKACRRNSGCGPQCGRSRQKT